MRYVLADEHTHIIMTLECAGAFLTVHIHGMTILSLLKIRPLQVILWFLVHRPHQILFLDFYLIIGFLSHYFYYSASSLESRIQK